MVRVISGRRGKIASSSQDTSAIMLSTEKSCSGDMTTSVNQRRPTERFRPRGRIDGGCRRHRPHGQRDERDPVGLQDRLRTKRLPQQENKQRGVARRGGENETDAPCR